MSPDNNRGSKPAVAFSSCVLLLVTCEHCVITCRSMWHTERSHRCVFSAWLCGCVCLDWTCERETANTGYTLLLSLMQDTHQWECESCRWLSRCCYNLNQKSSLVGIAANVEKAQLACPSDWLSEWRAPLIAQILYLVKVQMSLITNYS